MNQIRLSELLPGKTFHWLEFFVRNIPNTRWNYAYFLIPLFAVYSQGHPAISIDADITEIEG